MECPAPLLPQQGLPAVVSQCMGTALQRGLETGTRAQALQVLHGLARYGGGGQVLQQVQVEGTGEGGEVQGIAALRSLDMFAHGLPHTTITPLITCVKPVTSSSPHIPTLFKGTSPNSCPATRR